MALRKLSKEFLQLFEREVGSDDVPKLLSYLRQSYQHNYGRAAISKISTPVALFEYMSQKRDICQKEGREDFTKLIEALNDCGKEEIVEDLKDLIKRHKGTSVHDAAAGADAAGAGYDDFAAPAQKRPSQFAVKATDTAYTKSSYSPTDSIISPDGAGPVKRSRITTQNSYTSVYSDNGNDRLVNTTPRLYLSRDSHRYCVDDLHRLGLVAIINNFTDPNDRPPLFRRGTVEDEESLTKLFDGPPLRGAYQLDTDTPHQNLNRREFEDYLDQLVAKLKSGKFSSFLLFILSHGDKEGVKCYYNASMNQPADCVISVENITSKFNSVLPGRPRMIFIQACQGLEDNSPVTVEGDSVNTNNTQNGREDLAEDVEADDAQILVGPPRAADMLTAFATVQGFRAYRGKKGAWFISKLVEVIKESLSPDYYSTHIEDILTEVHRRVALLLGEATPSGGSDSTVKLDSKVLVKQMPYYQSSLRKKFYLLPNPRLPQ